MLKRQKEIKRAAKANRKREERQSRNLAKAAAEGEGSGPPIVAPEELNEAVEGGSGA
ncbi:MAG: hypothetical protein HZB25_06145 [Candidatus Eisenbacteria bacterium]|nr:hypothetical protein [Candidatus Eisenbacteria bacterium]